MAVMLVLVLLGSGMVTCRDTSPDLTSAVIQYSDTCKYSYNGFRCGDQCKWGGYCECGNTTIDIRRDARHCCVPAEASQGRRVAGDVVREDRQCSIDSYIDRYGLGVDDVKCARGVVTGIHDLCHFRCYNSYIDSEHLGPHAHFPCPDQCVPYRDMCRGVAWCREELQHCSQTLRCQWYEYNTPAVLGKGADLTRYCDFEWYQGRKGRDSVNDLLRL